MNALALLLALPVLAAREKPSQDEILTLLEKLHSDSIEEREEAAVKLLRLGKAALPELRKAARNHDPEVALRATDVIDRLVNPPEWRQYRDSGCTGLEVQAGKVEYVPTGIDPGYEILLDPQDILRKLKEQELILTNELPLGTKEARHLLQSLCAKVDIIPKGIENVTVKRRVILGSGRMSGYDVFKIVLLASNADMMLTTDRRMAIGKRREIFERLGKSSVKWPLRRYVSSGFNLDERDPDRY